MASQIDGSALAQLESVLGERLSTRTPMSDASTVADWTTMPTRRTLSAVAFVRETVAGGPRRCSRSATEHGVPVVVPSGGRTGLAGVARSPKTQSWFCHSRK